MGKEGNSLVRCVVGRGVVLEKWWRKEKRILKSVSVDYKLIPFNALSETQVKIRTF